MSDAHRQNFLIVQSLYPMIFSDIAPPDWSECALIILGSNPLSCILSIFEGVLTAIKMSPLVTSVHALLHQTSQIRLSYVSFLPRMRCTLRDRDAMAPLLPVDSWCKVCPILPFYIWIF